jgi:hypothetical protein
MGEKPCTQDEMDDIIGELIMKSDKTVDEYEMLNEYACANVEYFGYTPLMIAVLYDNDKAVIEFLKNPKVDINKKTDEGQTALILACMKEDKRDDVQEIIDNLEKERDGTNKEELELKKEFFETGGKVKRSQRGGGAENDANYKIINLLLEIGADVSIKDKSEKTAINYYNERPKSEKNDDEINNKFFIDVTDSNDIAIELDENKLGGGRKRRKSRKQRKSRKTRKQRKSRKQRKTRR